MDPAREEGEEGGLLAAAAAWLESCCQEQLACNTDGLLVLELNVVDLACSQAHSLLVEALLENPESVRQAAIAALEAAELLPAGQRVWLRPRQLPAGFELTVPEALECMRCAPGTLFAVHGVCIAASAVFQRPAACAFQCASCGKVCTLHSMDAPPPCCGGVPPQEVEQARVMVPGQVVFLAADGPLRSAPTAQLGGTLLAVALADDLCGRVRVGDRALVAGCGAFHGGAPAAMAPQACLRVTLGTQMEALNVEVLHPQLLSSADELGAGARRHLAAMAGGSLEAVLQTLGASLPEAAAVPSPLLQLALLMSAAAAGTGSTQLGGEGEEEEDPEPEAVLRWRGATSRNQVNVMLTAAGPEPQVQRLLGTLAGALCDHSVRGAAAEPRALLPVLEPKWADPALGVAAPLAVGGQLAEASPGVLLLSSSTLDTKRSIGLGQYMAAGEAALQQGRPELCMPVGATFWTLVHEQDLSKPGKWGPAAGPLSLTERIINRFSQPFFAQHDILLPASPETEDAVDMMADAILGAAAQGPPSRSSLRQQADALAALRHHLAAARAAPQPALSEAASSLLSAYFLHLRGCHDAQHGVLASLVRVACACARLRGSACVEPLPDAALAVALVEEKLLAAGAGPLFWPRWREELQRCTELGECLRGLADECGAGLGCGGGAATDPRLARAEE